MAILSMKKMEKWRKMSNWLVVLKKKFLFLLFFFFIERERERNSFMEQRGYGGTRAYLQKSSNSIQSL